MTTKRIPSAVSAYMAAIGRKGGKNGKGKQKVRKSAPRHKKMVDSK